MTKEVPPLIPKETKIFIGHESVVDSVRLSPDGNHVVSVGNNGVVRFWDVQTAMLQKIMHRHVTENAVTFSPDGTRLLFGVNGGFDLLDSRPPLNKVIGIRENKYPFVRAATFSPDGIHIFFGGDSPHAYIWNTQTNTMVTCFEENWVSVLCVSFSPDGQCVALGCNNGTFHVIDVFSGKKLFSLTRLEKVVTPIAYSPDGKLMAVSSLTEKGIVEIRETKQGFWLRSLDEDEHAERIDSITFSPDGSLIATASCDGTMFVWNVETREKIGKITLQSVKSSMTPERKLSISFSRDWSKLAVSAYPGDTWVFGVLDFGSPNLGMIPPEEALLYI